MGIFVSEEWWMCRALDLVWKFCRRGFPCYFRHLINLSLMTSYLLSYRHSYGFYDAAISQDFHKNNRFPNWEICPYSVLLQWYSAVCFLDMDALGSRFVFWLYHLDTIGVRMSLLSLQDHENNHKALYSPRTRCICLVYSWSSRCLGWHCNKKYIFF